jgi:hypothetical protein
LPVIVTVAPTTPDAGDRLAILGSTVKGTPLLATPETVTTTLPVVAPLGTVTPIDVALQLIAAAALPLKVTLLFPWLPPKLVPAIVTEVPLAPEVGDRLL